MDAARAETPVMPLVSASSRGGCVSGIVTSMRTSTGFFVLGFFVLGSFVGCSKTAPEPGKVVKVGDVCNEADGSRVRVSGYLRYRRGLMSFCSTFGGHETCDLELYESGERPQDFDVMRPRTGPEPVTAKLSVPVGTRTGEMDELPKKFTDADVKLHMPAGGNATDGSLITIDGKLSVIPGDPKAPSSAKNCFVAVEWVTAGAV